MMLHRTVLTLGLFGSLVLAACATQTSNTLRGSEIRLRYAEVTDIGRTQLPSSMPAGAAVGGFTGLVISRRSSSSRQLAAGATGAALGALVARSLDGDRRGYSYTLTFNDGSTSRFITEKGYLQRGDCVVVEEGMYSNIRRVASTLCTSSPAPDVVAALTMDARQCHAAKDELLAASTNEAIDAAARKVEILCQY